MKLLKFILIIFITLTIEIKAPSKTTRAAIAELEAGEGQSFDSVEALMADLNADD